MSFTRTKYDKNDYRRDLGQSVGSANYHINLPRNNGGAECFAANMPNAGFGGSVFRNIHPVDVDSELMGLSYPATRASSRKFSPKSPQVDQFADSNLIRFEECGNFANESTRLSNPPATLRATGINRWEWLCQNPQDRAIEPFTRVVDTMQIAKDNHRPCIPFPLERTAAPDPVNSVNADYESVMFYDDKNKYMERSENHPQIDYSSVWKSRGDL
jgi:hypothetical protein